MQRIACVIFTVYLLLLATMPCCGCIDVGESDISLSQGRHTHEKKACTPFCACASCAIDILVHETLLNTANELKQPNVIYFSNIVHDTINTSISIWRPPPYLQCHHAH